MPRKRLRSAVRHRPTRSRIPRISSSLLVACAIALAEGRRILSCNKYPTARPSRSSARWPCGVAAAVAAEAPRPRRRQLRTRTGSRASSAPRQPGPVTVTSTIVSSTGNTAFSPNPIKANSGDTVMFVNSDSQMHHIVIDGGSGSAAGRTWSDQPRLHGDQCESPSTSIARCIRRWSAASTARARRSRRHATTRTATGAKQLSAVSFSDQQFCRESIAASR